MSGTDRENRERESTYQGMREDYRISRHRFREYGPTETAPEATTSTPATETEPAKDQPTQ